MPNGKPNLLGSTICKICNQIIRPENAIFNKYKLQSTCKLCNKEKSKQWYNNNKEHVLRRIRENNFGITQDQYDVMNTIQFGGCAICKQPCKSGRNLSVDHDHQNGIIRDLLCMNCNAILGQANDNEELLFACIEYLKRHRLKYAV